MRNQKILCRQDYERYTNDLQIDLEIVTKYQNLKFIMMAILLYVIKLRLLPMDGNHPNKEIDL